MGDKKRANKKAKRPAANKPARQPPKIDKPPGEALPPSANAIPAQITPQRPGSPVAGIGASAGGLDAFKRFFGAMPPDSGIAFVLVPHLDPAHESLMVELLARHTTMPVAEAENGMPVEANHVYIIPPNKYMTIAGGILRLTGPVERRSAQTSIDLFLRSLAEDQQERSICIILSGTGSHGAVGLKAVKAAGGMAMVQDPATAEYERMPQSAVATGQADYVLPAEQLPDALVKYVKHAYVNGASRIDAAQDTADQLIKVLALLRTRSKFDFRAYRRRMLSRRIERRMGLNHLDSIPEYLAFLRGHPEELKLLVKDLFISVTSFFRDPEAFQHLASEVVAPLVQAKEADAVIRVWVPGCATGEEPYSIAMLVQEELAAAHKNCRVQIFATDVDEDALEAARLGLYPGSIAADIAPERLARFFTKIDEHSYQINKQLRETVIFAAQNLISDAPFTKLDLISCRNLLIYLEPDVQKKVVTLFHFALSEQGFLFLGPSETIGRQIDLFEPLSKKWRTYRRIGPTRPERVDIPIVAAMGTRGMSRRPAETAGVQPINFAEVTQRLLLNEFAPAAVLINRKYEIFYYFGPCTRYLELPTGQPTHDLSLMAREGLRTKLRGAVHRAIRENETVELADVHIKHNGGYHPVRVSVRPVQAPIGAEGLLLITFVDAAPSAQPSSPPAARRVAEPADESTLRQLEVELKATREDLQGTIEEMESSNEELKASNEEVMSMNEELQSTNEELETSKEEMQSLNEELSTVNSQLHEKVDELEKANNDMANLLTCTDIATVFLDTSIRIRLFTPAATRLFKLIASDVGRSVGDLTPQFSDPDLVGDAQHVLQQLAPREKEVMSSDGSWWIRRIMPYRTRDNRIDGVVITFLDVTERKRAADAVVRRLAAIVESSADAIFSHDLDGTVRTWNRGAEQLYGYQHDEIVGRSTRLHIPEDRVEEWTRAMSRLARGEHVKQLETERLRKDGQRFFVEMTYSPLRDSNGMVVGASVTARDLSERKRAEETHQLQGQVTANLAEGVLLTRARDGVIVYANERFEKLFGYDPGELLGQHVSILNAGEGERPREQAEEIIRVLHEKKVWSGEVHNVRKDGTVFWSHSSISTFDHPNYGTVWIGALSDTTKRKQIEQALQASEMRFRLMADAAPVMIWMSGPDKLCTWFNRVWLEFVGRSMERELGNGWTENIHADDFDRCTETYTAAFDARQPFSMEYRLQRHDREYRWLLDNGAPMYGAEGDFMGYIGSCLDITERKQLEREVVETASLEQRRIGQDLHDSVAQELTALSILARDLAETVQSDPARAPQLVGQMTQGLQRSQQELRAVLRGLLPVAVDAAGLMAALADLAESIQNEGKVTCAFDCPAPIAVADNLTATHLYLIAKEAVHNAVKHAQARNVGIALKANGGLVLTVRDDGIGMPDRPPPPIPFLSRREEGLGLRIMRNRAAIIGAKLTIAPAEPTGTVVTCILPRKTYEAQQNQSASTCADHR